MNWECRLYRCISKIHIKRGLGLVRSKSYDYNKVSWRCMNHLTSIFKPANGKRLSLIFNFSHSKCPLLSLIFILFIKWRKDACLVNTFIDVFEHFVISGAKLHTYLQEHFEGDIENGVHFARIRSRLELVMLDENPNNGGHGKQVLHPTTKKHRRRTVVNNAF